MFATDPFGVRASYATLLVLIAAALWGYGIILMRQIARMEPTLLQMLSINTVFFIATGIASLLEWRPLSTTQLMLLIAVGVIGGLAQFLVFEAARLIPASVMATVEYTALPWAFLLGYWIWLDIPATSVSFSRGIDHPGRCSFGARRTSSLTVAQHFHPRRRFWPVRERHLVLRAREHQPRLLRKVVHV